MSLSSIKILTNSATAGHAKTANTQTKTQTEMRSISVPQIPRGGGAVSSRQLDILIQHVDAAVAPAFARLGVVGPGAAEQVVNRQIVRASKRGSGLIFEVWED
jgi:hypothetical protein